MSNYEGTITLDIRQYMDYGLEVYDVDSNKVGNVDSYDRNAGYMTVQSNPFSNKDLYIPFSAITHIDPREVFVSKSKDELHREYSSPPPRNTLVEEKIDIDTGEDVSRAITSEPSGYDGSPVVVDMANVGKLSHHIAPGFHVYTSEMDVVGTVKQYDRESKRLLVERGMFSKHDLFIPVALVDSVNREDRDIYLAVSSDDLKRMQNGGPGEVVIVEVEQDP
jgi:hypothetical protein